MAYCRTSVPNQLPRYQFRHKIFSDVNKTRDIDISLLSEIDFKNWSKQVHPTVQLVSTSHKNVHEHYCKFIFDHYLEFTDRQYISNTGYRRSKEENWDQHYESYVTSNYTPSYLNKVISEFKTYGFQTETREPEVVNKKDHEQYFFDAQDSFLTYSKSQFPFDPDWGHWWKKSDIFDERELLNIKLDRHFGKRLYPTLPEVKYIKEEKQNFFSLLDEEFNNNNLWRKNLNNSWNLHRDCYWKISAVPEEPSFFKTSLRKTGYVAGCEGRILFFLTRKLHWKKTVERITIRALKQQKKRERIESAEVDARIKRRRIDLVSDIE